MDEPEVNYSDAIKVEKKNIAAVTSDMKIIDSVLIEVCKHKELFKKYEISISFKGKVMF